MQRLVIYVHSTHKTHKYTINWRYYVGNSAEICVPLFTRLVEFSHADTRTMLCHQHSSKHIYVQHFIQHAAPPHKIKLKFLTLQCTIRSLKRLAMKVSLDVSSPPYLYIRVYIIWRYAVRSSRHTRDAMFVRRYFFPADEAMKSAGAFENIKHNTHTHSKCSYLQMNIIAIQIMTKLCPGGQMMHYTIHTRFPWGKIDSCAKPRVPMNIPHYSRMLDGSLNGPSLLWTSTARTAKWYLCPSMNWVSVQAIGSGNARTSPTFFQWDVAGGLLVSW